MTTTDMQNLPLPLVPAEVDLSDFTYMGLDVRRLRDSRIALTVTGDEFRAAVLLWCSSWNQKPAASLPDDDVELAQLAGFGRFIGNWKKVRAGALYGFVKCNDGRLYHPVVAEKAIEAWMEQIEFRWRRECDRIRKANKVRQADGLEPIACPSNPMVRNSDGRKTFSAGNTKPSDGVPAENALKGKGKEREMKGNNIDAEPSSALPIDPVQTPPPRVSDREADLYRRGKEVLGDNAGSLIKKLVTAKSGSIPQARAAIETASEKSDPREYIGAIIKGRDSPDDLRARGEAW